MAKNPCDRPDVLTSVASAKPYYDDAYDDTDVDANRKTDDCAEKASGFIAPIASELEINCKVAANCCTDKDPDDRESKPCH